MSNMEIFNQEQHVSMDNVKKVVEKKLEPSWVKSRKQGGATLKYIEGHAVIRLLNTAFDYAWSFEIIDEQIVESLPKQKTKYENGRRVDVLDKNGEKVYMPQPPVVKVLGRLTVPGYGTKEQYGSKVIIGGATEQESAFKSASTDAMKKCASLFGIGLELWGDEGILDDEIKEAEEQGIAPPVEKPQAKQPQTPQQTQPKPQQTQQAQQAPQQENPWANQQPAPEPQTQATQGAQTSSGQAVGWQKVDTDRLKDLKQILAIEDNQGLDVYAKEFFGNQEATYRNISPNNIAAFNAFLTSKAENI